MSGYRLDLLSPDDVAGWDGLVRSCRGREVFHQSPWLDYLAASRGVEVLRWAIRDEGETVGYFCGGLLRKGPFRVLGSPLRSWATNSMGPVSTRQLDLPRFVDALDVLAVNLGLGMIELEQPALTAEVLRPAGYQPVENWTYRVRLDPADPQAMWRRLDSTCRNRIRKAEAAGLSVEDTDDPAIVDEYYAFFLELMRRKAMRPPFGRESVRLLFQHLRGAGRLFALRVRSRDGRVLAAGLFPHDDLTMYFWSGASRHDTQAMCPNDLMHWTAMCRAADLGLTAFDMSGQSRFKRKFGGVLTPAIRWHKCYSAAARLARTAYQTWFDVRTHATVSRAAQLLPIAARWRGDHAPSASPLHRSVRRDVSLLDDILHQHLRITPGMHLLEVDPGHGCTARRLARRVTSLAVLDISWANAAMLRRTFRRHPNVRTWCADVERRGLSELLGQDFDVVYALRGLPLSSDPRACFGNLAAIIRPGGSLLAYFPRWSSARSPGQPPLRTAGDVRALIADAGFSEVSIGAAHGFDVVEESPWTASSWRSRLGAADVVSIERHAPLRRGMGRSLADRVLHTARSVATDAKRRRGPGFQHREAADVLSKQCVLVLARR